MITWSEVRTGDRVRPKPGGAVWLVELATASGPMGLTREPDGKYHAGTPDPQAEVELISRAPVPSVEDVAADLETTDEDLAAALLQVHLGAELIGTQHDDDTWTVPPISGDVALRRHLFVFHGIFAVDDPAPEMTHGQAHDAGQPHVHHDHESEPTP